jgi:hypothetical protein
VELCAFRMILSAHSQPFFQTAYFALSCSVGPILRTNLSPIFLTDLFLPSSAKTTLTDNHGFKIATLLFLFLRVLLVYENKQPHLVIFFILKPYPLHNFKCYIIYISSCECYRACFFAKTSTLRWIIH